MHSLQGVVDFVGHRSGQPTSGGKFFRLEQLLMSRFLCFVQTGIVHGNGNGASGRANQGQIGARKIPICFVDEFECPQNTAVGCQRHTKQRARSHPCQIIYR